MKVLVLVKQVPDTETKIRVDASGTGIVTDGITFIPNPYDEYGIEAALKLREAYQGEVNLLTLGPERAKDALRTGLAMGADNAYHICDPAFDGAGPLDVAKALAEGAKRIGFDLILAGQSAVDGGSAFVGAAVAEHLDIPSVTFLVKIDGGPDSFTLNRESDDGLQEISCGLPALWTCQKGLNEPRYPSLPGIMKAKKKDITAWTAADLGLSPAPLRITRLELPPERQAGKMIPGDGKEAAQELVRLLREEAKVL